MSLTRRPYLVDELRVHVELAEYNSTEFTISGTLFTQGQEMGELFWNSIECNMSDLQEGELLEFVSQALRSVLVAFRTDLAPGGGGQLTTNDWGSPATS